MSSYNGLCVNAEDFESEMYNNCYTYAINQPLNPHTNEPYRNYDHCQPGYLGGKGNRLGNCHGNDHIKLIERAKQDLKKIGYKMIESSYEEYIDNNDCWKVAFCYCDSDYHWYRQNDDGTWSHKKGMSYIHKTDNSGNIIYNPEICDRGRYVNFVGFFIIKKIKRRTFFFKEIIKAA